MEETKKSKSMKTIAKNTKVAVKEKGDIQKQIEEFQKLRKRINEPLPKEDVKLLNDVLDIVQQGRQPSADLKGRIDSLPQKTQQLIFSAIRVADQKQLDYIQKSLLNMSALTTDEIKAFMTEIKRLDGIMKLKRIAKTEQVKDLLTGYSTALKSQLVFKK